MYSKSFNFKLIIKYKILSFKRRLTNKMKDLVILAGGKGLRLGGLTKKNQKTMLNFAKIPFLRYLLNYYCKFNINKIFIITSFNSKNVFKEFHKKKINLVDIFCVNQQKPNGTAKALQLVKNKVSKEFILANGDTFFETNLDKLLKLKLKKNYGCMVLIRKNKDIFSQKLNTLSIKNKFVTFNSSTSSLVSSGVMLLSKKIFNFIDNKSTSFENDVLQKKIEQKKILGFEENAFFLDIGSKSNYKKGQNLWIQKFKKPAIFLDRDGVINKNRNDYNYKISNFRFNKGILKLMKIFLIKNFYIFIVTNQAGIAKKKYSQNYFLKLQKFIKFKLDINNIKIDHVEFCPHHPNAKDKKLEKKCSCRKPNNGMIKKILSNWIIDKKNSLMVGDKITDKICAKKSGIKYYYFSKKLYKELN